MTNEDQPGSLAAVAQGVAEDVQRFTQNVAYVTSAMISNNAGQPPAPGALSAYHQAVAEMLGFRPTEQSPSALTWLRKNVLSLIWPGSKPRNDAFPPPPPNALKDTPKPKAQHTLFQSFLIDTSPPGTYDESFVQSVRKEMAVCELQAIDDQIAKLRRRRKLIFERLASVECEVSNGAASSTSLSASGDERGEHVRDFRAPDEVRYVDYNSPFGQLALATPTKVLLADMGGEEFIELPGTNGKQIRGLAVHGTDPVVACGAGQNLCIWRPSSAEDACLPVELKGHVKDITAVSLDSEHAVTSSLDCTVRVWDEQQCRSLATIDMFAYGGCSALQHSGSALAVGTQDGIVRLYDLRQPLLRASGVPNVARELLGGHTLGVSALSFENLELCSGALDGSLRLWDLRSGSIQIAEAHANAINTINFDAAKIVASVRGETGVRVLSRPTGEHRVSANGELPVTAARYLKGYLVTGRSDGSAQVWTI